MALKLSKTIPALYATEKIKAEDKVIHARLFALGSAATWLIAEYNPETKIAYGYADLFGGGREAEWGYISIEELEADRYEPLKGMPSIPRVELDAHFTKKPFRECINQETGSIL